MFAVGKRTDCFYSTICLQIVGRSRALNLEGKGLELCWTVGTGSSLCVRVRRMSIGSKFRQVGTKSELLALNKKSLASIITLVLHKCLVVMLPCSNEASSEIDGTFFSAGKFVMQHDCKNIFI